MRKFEAISTEIKTLSDLQKVLKPQVKQNFSGTRTSQYPSNDRDKNRYELRHLFQAYSILKGIERQEIKKPSNYNGVILDQKKVDSMIEKYRPVEVLE